MFSFIHKYIKWLHTRWPAGGGGKLPFVRENGMSNVEGFYIVGDLTGIPLLKFSADSGARAVRHVLSDDDFNKIDSAKKEDEILDIMIVGAGVSGMSAALEARKSGLKYELLEATEPFSTIVNFPKGKPIYTYPTEMKPAGDIQFTAQIKEPLVDELKGATLDSGIVPHIARVERVIKKGDVFEIEVAAEATRKARRVIVGIGRSGNFRKLDVPGEDLGKCSNRLHDPEDYTGKNVLVVGGGDSALECAIAVVRGGANVTLSYRGESFSRPKPENIECLYKLVADPQADVAVETPVSERVTTSTAGYLDKGQRGGKLTILMNSSVSAISENEVLINTANNEKISLKNDAVFTMTGREAPLDFFRRSAVKIRGELRAKQWIYLAAFVLFCAFVYNWKAGGTLTGVFQQYNLFPFNIEKAADASTLIGTFSITASEPGFYYSVLYTLLVLGFGIRRIKMRKTPYIKLQTWSLAAVQIIPLFLLPYILLPYLGHNGFFDSGAGAYIADNLFPAVDYGHGREYWRAFGFILAWPLFLWNVFTWQPMWWWLMISLVQTFILIPVIVYFWGKGAYCGWICSCGAMAETLGDDHRHKMPHGALWNRVNMIGQVILGISLILLLSRIFSWAFPQSGPGESIRHFYEGLLYGWQIFGVQLNYKYVVDLFLAGIIGYGAYFWFSGRVWCRFACPLAALMHIYARFSKFRIFSEKKKCISCNMCTSVCHQGIDIMNFANKGIPMEDPECVRCSACVHTCPTGVLQFGHLEKNTGKKIYDSIPASPVLMRESESTSL